MSRFFGNKKELTLFSWLYLPKESNVWGSHSHPFMVYSTSRPCSSTSFPKGSSKGDIMTYNPSIPCFLDQNVKLGEDFLPFLCSTMMLEKFTMLKIWLHHVFPSWHPFFLTSMVRSSFDVVNLQYFGSYLTNIFNPHNVLNVHNCLLIYFYYDFLILFFINF